MTANPHFWNKIADKYAARPVGNPEAYEHKLSLTRDLLTRDSVVAEFGCGTGTTALIHAPHVRHVWATDVSEKMIEIAWRKAQEQRIDNVEFEVADIDEYVPEAERYDVVMMHSLLHLLENRRSAIEKAFAMLKPGGYFVSNTVCMTGMMLLMKPVIGLMQLFGQAPRVSFVSAETILAEIREAGFDIEDEWRPAKSPVVFVIARKPASAG